MDVSEYTDSICLNAEYKAKSERHPGGQKTTRRLIKLSDIEPCRILDMGAGSGTTLKLLKELGFDACGIDLEPGEGVTGGNMLRTGFPDGSFEALISECAFLSRDMAAQPQGSSQAAQKAENFSSQMFFMAMRKIFAIFADRRF